MGQIAAKMSKTGTLGYIGSFPIPEVVSGINAMMLGAQSVRPDMKVKIIWVNTWYDPGKEAAAARALADQGADILTQHTDLAAAMQFANERGIFAFGQDFDMIKFGPKAQLTAIINNWTPYYVERVKLALDNKWATGDVWGGLSSKIVQMAPYTNMPDDVKKLAMETEAAITAGTLHPFKCPVIGQDGKTGGVQGRRQSRRRADPQHELFHQGDRREAAGEVRDIPSPAKRGGWPAVGRPGGVFAGVLSQTPPGSSLRSEPPSPCGGGIKQMDVFLGEWVNLLLRWFHMIVGIGWIGTSFYFMALDYGLDTRERKSQGVYGTAWQVHGGGFYHVEKFTVAPPQLPAHLHWFKWDAYLTWMTGFGLLIVQYYLHADAYLIDPAVMPLAPWQAIAISVVSLIAGWVIYEALCRSPLGQNTTLLAILVFALILIASVLYTKVFSARGAFLHVGAFVGTIMAFNVFMVIIPNQRKMVAQLLARRNARRALRCDRQAALDPQQLPDAARPGDDGVAALSVSLDTSAVLAGGRADHRGGRADPPFHQSGRCRRGRCPLRLDAAGRGLRADLRDLAHRAARAGGDRRGGDRHRSARTRGQALHQLPRAQADARKLQGSAKERHAGVDGGAAQIRGPDPHPDGAEQGDAARQPDRHDRRGTAEARSVARGAALNVTARKCEIPQ